MIDSEVTLRKREEELIKIVESIDEVLKTRAWQTLKELLWDKRMSSLERQLLIQAKADEIETKKLYRLQGEFMAVKHYGDLKKYAETLEKELKGVKDKLQ